MRLLDNDRFEYSSAAWLSKTRLVSFAILKVLLTADPEIPVPPKLYGGIERIVDGLATELRFRGHTVGLVANPESTARVNYFLPWASKETQSPLTHLQNSFLLRRAVSEFHPQVVHSFSRLG